MHRYPRFFFVPGIILRLRSDVMQNVPAGVLLNEFILLANVFVSWSFHRFTTPSTPLSF